MWEADVKREGRGKGRRRGLEKVGGSEREEEGQRQSRRVAAKELKQRVGEWDEDKGTEDSTGGVGPTGLVEGAGQTRRDSSQKGGTQG